MFRVRRIFLRTIGMVLIKIKKFNSRINRRRKMLKRGFYRRKGIRTIN